MIVRDTVKRTRSFYYKCAEDEKKKTKNVLMSWQE